MQRLGFYKKDECSTHYKLGKTLGRCVACSDGPSKPNHARCQPATLYELAPFMTTPHVCTIGVLFWLAVGASRP